MRSVIVAGGSYGEALPSGAYAVLVPGVHLETGFGLKVLPSQTDWPLFLRITERGGFQVAGQASNSYGCWHYSGGAWTLDPRIPNGQSAAIFDQAGELRILTPGPNQSTQGYRYVADDGSLVLGDATYFDRSMDLNEYTEYTIAGERVVVGQGHTTGGAVILYKGQRYLIEPGNCTFLRFNHDADRCAVTVVTPNATKLFWFTVQEILALPLDRRESPKEPPPPPPPPHPKEPPMAVDHTDVVQQIARETPPEKTVAGAFAFVMRVAWALRGEGCGLLEKPSGENIVSYQGTSYSASRVCYPDRHIYKVLSDVPATNGPKWADEGFVADPKQLYRPALPVGFDPPPTPLDPTGPPSPPPAPTGDLAKKVAALVSIVAGLEARLAALEGPCAFRSATGRYLCAEGGGGGEVNATRRSAGSWETWIREPKG